MHVTTKGQKLNLLEALENNHKNINPDNIQTN